MVGVSLLLVLTGTLSCFGIFKAILLAPAAGDLGTSPLYVYSTIFDKKPSHDDVLCATSLIFWSITLVVLLKYVFIVLLADDNGEGGLCTMPLLDSTAGPARTQQQLCL